MHSTRHSQREESIIAESTSGIFTGFWLTCHCYEFSRRYELHDGKVYRRSFGPLHHRKQTKKSKKYLALPNYPFQKLFPTFDAFMTEYWGCESGEEDGRYGYYFNPNDRLLNS